MATTDDQGNYSVIVTLKMPTECNNFIPYARGIHSSMTNSDRFSSLSAKLGTFDSTITKLSDAQTACKSKPPTGTVQTRNTYWSSACKELKTLKGNVQEIADNDPVNAKAIAIDAGMSYKLVKKRGSQKPTAKDGPDEGSVILFAGVPGPSNWRESKDDENWNNLTGSKTSRKNLKNRIPGEVYFYQYSQPLPNGEDSPWSESIRIRLKKY
jgi:hypothetical protein